VDCPGCDIICEQRSCLISIPKFKELIIFSMNCEDCGYKSNEIKVGGNISSMGTKYILKVKHDRDL